jgi:hypothetical protein
MYFLFFFGGMDLDSFIILGFSYVPMLQSSTSLLLASIFGFLATLLKSNKSSNKTKPLGNTLFFNCRISESTSFSLNSLASIVFTLPFSKTYFFTNSSPFSKSMFVHSK